MSELLEKVIEDARVRRQMEKERWLSIDAVVPFFRRAAVDIHDAHIWDLIDFYEQSPPPCPPANFASDLRRTQGDAGRLYLGQLIRSCKPNATDAEIDAVWAGSDRPRMSSDWLLIDAMDRALSDGMKAEPEIVAAIEALRNLADKRRELNEATNTYEEATTRYKSTLHGEFSLDELKTARAARRDAITVLRRAKFSFELEDLIVKHAQTKKADQQALPPPPSPSNIPGPGGIPLLGAQAVIVDLGGPIVDGFVSGQRDLPAIDAPTLPDATRGYPLFEQLNLAIAHAVAMAQRSPSAFRASAVVDVLGVLALTHEDTFKTVIARIRGFGCALPEGRLATATKRFEMQVKKELRSGMGWRTNPRTGDPDPANADNVGVLLRYVGTSLRFNVWRQRIEIKSPDGTWQSFTDAELNRLRAVASADEYRFRPTKDFMRDMLSDIARQATYDPVLDWIDSAIWDGQPRLVTWLARTCGVAPDLYHQALGKNVIGGIVKRARHPGVKHDEVMILIGKQGCGKSNLTKVLALQPEWHTDGVAFEGRPQDIVPQLHGKLVIELSELDGLHRRDVGYIKRFLSTQTDNFTAKYEAYASDHARRCVFVGTCNLENPLVDESGNRRFYPVRIPDGVQIDVDWLRANIMQLIAEAAHLESAGATFEIPKEVWATAATVQETARSVSAVEELLMRWFTKVTVPGTAGYFVLSSDIVSALTMARQNANAKVGGVMERLGYVHRRPYVNGVQMRAWIKSPSDDIKGCIQLVPAASVAGGPVEMRPR
jgi:energy-coupling factor transporter ATP-binding protein EcfA2